MRPPHRPLLVLLVGLIGPAFAAEPSAFGAADEATAGRLRDGAMAGSPAFAIVESLTTEVGPRLSGSAGDRAAVAWAEAKLKALGLSHVRKQAVEVPHWVRGEADVRLEGTPPRALVGAALGGSIATPAEGLEAEVVPFADLRALSAAPDGSLAGKIAYVGKRMPRARDGSGYGQTVDARHDGPAVASAKGAVGFVLRSVGTDHDRIAHTGTTDYADGTVPVPAVAISNPDADLLERRLASGTPVRLALTLTPRLLPEASSANVIGEIPGAERPEEIVLLGAHLDSWDLGEGAIDDGAGVAIVTAAARQILILGIAPRRTIRIVLFAHEEGGGRGARAYAAEAAASHEVHVAALEADSGGGQVWGFKTSVRPDAVRGLAALGRVLAPLGATSLGNTAHGGADLALLHAAGVPVFDLVQDSTLYFDVHHTANDTLDKLKPRDLDQVVAAFAASAWLLANTTAGFGPAPAGER